LDGGEPQRLGEFMPEFFSLRLMQDFESLKEGVRIEF
jgi:hypothetical protein